MKKNFLKQLACVLSLAMVVTSVAPATTAVEAAKASSLNAKAATISVGGKFDINVKNKVKGTKYTYDYMYTAGKNYVTLNKKTGVVTGKKAGKATIKCIAKKGKTTKILKCVITVAPKATKVTINNAEGNSTIKVGDKFQFKATVTPGNAGKSTWSISDSSVFKVDKNNGYVRALKPGKATLTVTNGTVSDKVELTAAADYSATQSGVKTITVTSPVMLKESDIKLKKGNSTISLADKGITLSDDKLSAEIKTAGKLVDGTYKVTLNTDKTLEFTAATEKVSKIELLSEKAALTASTSSQATVGYRVANQFGEDITKTTNVQVSGSHSAKGDGKGTVTFDKGAIFNQNVDIVSVVIIHTETGITAQGTLTVSAAKAVSEVILVEEVYNEDGKKLDGDSDLLKDDYYILFEAKDQYGGEMTEIQLKVDGNKNAEAFITLAAGVTNLKVADGAKENVKTKKITKNGKNYAAVKLASSNTKKDEEGKISAGPATINVIGATGKQASGTITVAEGTQAITLSITPVDTVLAGNTNDFTFEATDANGNAVTKYSSLKKVAFNGKNSVEANVAADKTGMMYFEEDYSTGNAKLKYKADNASYDTPVYIQIQLTNLKTTQANFTVKANATPRVITKVDKDLNVMSTDKGEKKFEVKAENLKMENQYGSEISFENMRDSGYKVQVTTKDDNNDYITLSGLSTVTSTTPYIYTFTNDSKKGDVVFSVSTNKKSTTDIVEKTYNLKLLNAKGETVSGSDYDLTISIYPQGKLTGYEVKEVKPLYVTSKGSYNAGDAFGRELEVTAKRSGTKVVLDAAEFNVIGTDDIGVDTVDGKKKIYSKKDTEFKDNITEIKQTIKVVINATGDEIPVDVLLKNEAPKVTSVEKGKSGDIKTSNGIVNASTLFAKDVLELKVKTQYDNGEATVENGKVYYKLNSAESGDKKDFTPRITFTDWSDGVATPKNNGTKNAEIDLAAANKSVMVSLDFGNGQIVKFKVFS